MSTTIKILSERRQTETKGLRALAAMAFSGLVSFEFGTRRGREGSEGGRERPGCVRVGRADFVVLLVAWVNETVGDHLR